MRAPVGVADGLDLTGAYFKLEHWERVLEIASSKLEERASRRAVQPEMIRATPSTGPWASAEQIVRACAKSQLQEGAPRPLQYHKEFRARSPSLTQHGNGVHIDHPPP